jgi:ParB-like chromosome segregation protein Spo0J
MTKKTASTPPAWPATKIEMLAVEQLVPYARNARTHSDEQIEQIARMIDTYGFTNAVLIDEKGMILAGHGRVLAAKKRGIASLPVMRAIGWTDAQKRAYQLDDNKVTANAGWDAELLRQEIEGLAGTELFGFSGDEIAAITADAKPNVREIETSQVSDKFWITIEGKLEDQAEVLDRLKKFLDDLVPGKCRYEMGTLNQLEL